MCRRVSGRRVIAEIILDVSLNLIHGLREDTLVDSGRGASGKQTVQKDAPDRKKEKQMRNDKMTGDRASAPDRMRQKQRRRAGRGHEVKVNEEYRICFPSAIQLHRHKHVTRMLPR